MFEKYNTQNERVVQKPPENREGHNEIFNWSYLSIVGPVRVPWTTAVELKFLEGAHFNALYI